MIVNIFAKEFLELIRDRKHLFVTLLLPILLTPLLMFGVGIMQAKAFENEESEIIRYTLDDEFDIGLEAILETQASFELVSIDSELLPEQAVTDELVDLVVSVTQVKNTWLVTLVYKQTGLSGSRLRSFQDEVDTLSNQMTSERLIAAGIEVATHEQLLNPIDVDKNNLATTKETLGQLLGGMLPFMIMVWMMSSSLAIASDIVAGEKERGTLETLIISPVPLLDIIIGKWLLISLSGWVSGILTLISIWVSGIAFVSFVGGNFLNEVIQFLSFGTIVLGLLFLLPTAGLVAAVMLVTASVAHSFKEAQSYGSGVMMLFFIPLFATMTGTVTLSIKTAFIPIVNTNTLFTELLKGTLDWVYVIPSLLINGCIVFGVLVAALAMYRSEKILFRN